LLSTFHILFAVVDQMARIFSLILVWALLLRTAVAHEVRHITFPSGLLGTWAEKAELCAAKGKSNILIEPAKYGDISGSCKVQWRRQTRAVRIMPYTRSAQAHGENTTCEYSHPTSR
jgi:hypothetical protein